MTDKHFFTSLTRISNLKEVEFSVEKLPREEWGTGDYVVGEVDSPPGGLDDIELDNGREVEVVEGDLIVGAFGERYATLEEVGRWQDIGDDLEMAKLTPAGIFGKVTSKSTSLPRILSLSYKGHVLVEGEKAAMQDYTAPPPERAFELPVVLLIGTSMSAGKSTTGKVIVRLLKEAGLTVVGAKLAGAARYRDVLGMQDAGADYVFDFVDAGLPSTLVPQEDYRQAVHNLMSLMAGTDADVAVVEIGASLLEPYNGETAIQEIGPNTRYTVLSASDPYAVAGMLEAFDSRPNLVTGPAASTDAAIELVERLTGLEALDILDRDSLPKLKTMLTDALET